MRRSPAPLDRFWLDATLDSSSDALAFYGPDGRFLKVNPAFEKLLGYSRRELAGKSFLDITPREHHAACRRVFERLLTTGRADTFEKDYLRRDGRRVAVAVSCFRVRDEAGATLGYASTVRDVTAARRELSRIAANLRDSLSMAEAALESTADGLLIVDRRGRVARFNRRFLEMWGIPRRLAEAGDDRVLIASVLGRLKDPKAFLARVKRLYARPREESFDTLEFRDGSVFERYSRPQVLGGRVVGRVWSFRDVTTARRLERALADLSSREHAKIGRELHDSIGQVFTALSLLARSADGPSADPRLVLRRIEAVSRDGVRQIRLLARGLLPPGLQDGDLKDSLHALESSSRELFGLKCDVVVDDLPPADPAFATEVYRIAQEAVRNAAKHSGGTRARVLVKLARGRLDLRVSDDGHGMRAGRLGRGLGLAIMRQRAAHLGGTLDIASGASGTTIRCGCPFIARAAGKGRAPASASPRPRG